MTTSRRTLLIALAVLSALFVSAACVGSDTAPAQDSNFTPAKADATTAPVPTKAPKATVAPTSTTAPAPTTAPAETIAPTATTAPAATVAPQPTATTAPAPTEVPAVDNGPWMTGLEAMALASASGSGTIAYIDGHAASAAGEKDTSDKPSDTTSPAAGYGTYWTVAFVTESGSTNFCSVIGQDVECSESGYTPPPGDVSGAMIDSTEIFSVLATRTDAWNELAAKGNLSLLLVLEPGSGELDPTHTYWTAIATAQGATSGIGGGTFHWDLDTDTLSHTTWSH